MSDTVHTCRVCGKKEDWNNGWSWRFIMYQDKSTPELGYEEVFKMCSEECKNIAEKKIKWVVKI